MVTINAVDNMANGSMNFLETYEVSEFKALMGVSKIDIKQNPNTGKLFMVFGTKVGKVTTKGKGANGAIVDPVVSKLDELDRDGNPVYLLHERGNGAAALQTL